MFPGSVSEWNEDQIRLTFWTAYYDDVYNHPECPDEATINNDRLLDAWIKDINEQTERERKGEKAPHKSSTEYSSEGGKIKMEKKDKFFFNNKTPSNIKLPKGPRRRRR